MKNKFSATVLTLYPDMFPGPLGKSLIGKALADSIWSLQTLNIRDFATDKHQTVDDSPYGGGAGMVIRPDILDAAIGAAKNQSPEARLVFPSPRGAPLTQTLVEELPKTPIILLCGRFEGIDERVLEVHNPLEVSLGDFVLCGGEIAAMAILEACVRLLPGVLGEPASLAEESFGNHPDYAGLLEYPHYTRPPVWNGMQVPEVLLSGDHAAIQHWRLNQARKLTQARRLDLWEKYEQYVAKRAAGKKE